MKRIFWDVVVGRILPALAFGLLTFAKGVVATEAQLTADESAVAAIHFVAQLAVFFFFALSTIAVVTRTPRLGGRRDAVTIFVVIVGAFVVAAASSIPSESTPLRDLLASMLITLGTGWALWGLLHLRRSFSLLPEARELVTTGPFAITRHPLYLGEVIAAAGVVVSALSPLALGAYAIMLATVVLRVRWEERVLIDQIPEYADYVQRVPRWLPFSRATRSN